jgi:hypothetical protein
MRLRSLVAATALAVALPALTVTTASASTPAHRAAAKVTLKDLPASAEVGQKLKVAGTAKLVGKGKRAKRVKVTVQRRYGAGGWQNVATTRTGKSGRYAVKVALTQGGTTSFRVKRAGGGTTAADSLSVYQWLNLVDVPFLVGGSVAEVRRVARIGGRAFPGSIQIPNGGGGLALKPNGLCTAFEFWTGFLDSPRAVLPPTPRHKGGLGAYGAPTQAQTSFSTPVGPAVRVSLNLTGQRYVFGEMMVADAPDADLVVASPRVRCNAATIPEMDWNELSL